MDKVLQAIIKITPDQGKGELRIHELVHRLIIISSSYLFLPPEANISTSWEKAADILQGFLDGSEWAETARKVFKGELDYKDYLK